MIGERGVKPGVTSIGHAAERPGTYPARCGFGVGDVCEPRPYELKQQANGLYILEAQAKCKRSVTPPGGHCSLNF